MIPRIKTGTSFKGAGLYYLHDKRREGDEECLTSERVAWTHAINTLETEPEAVLAEMRQTAFDQPILKLLSGNRIDGRPTERTVMTVALAWSPHQRPTREEMIEAGHSFLQHMKWEAHQVLFVAHNDTEHSHVHLIINRVHPETGMTIDDAWRKTRAQQWALGFEREHGKIYCEAREAKYGRDAARDGSHMSYGEWRMWQEISKDGAFDPEFREALEAGEWQVLKDGQRDARVSFWKETGRMRNELRAALREEVRAEFAAEWRDYAKVKAERDNDARKHDREARHAIRELRKQGGALRQVRNNRPDRIRVERRADGSTAIRRPADRTDDVTVVRGPDGRTYMKRRRFESEGIEQVKERQRQFHRAQREELWEIRSAIIAEQKARLEALASPALARLSADRARTYAALLATQREAKADLRRDQGAGERRYDVLGTVFGTQTPALQALTPVQTAAYIAHARERTAQAREFDAARKEVQTSPSEPHQGKVLGPEQEKTERRVASEQGATNREQVNQRQAEIEWYLEKRKQDRARDRGGGGRER